MATRCKGAAIDALVGAGTGTAGSIGLEPRMAAPFRLKAVHWMLGVQTHRLLRARGPRIKNSLTTERTSASMVLHE